LEALGAGLQRFADSAELRQELAAWALRSREKLDLSYMVDAFDQGVRRALDRSTSTHLGDPLRRESSWDFRQQWIWFNFRSF